MAEIKSQFVGQLAEIFSQNIEEENQTLAPPATEAEIEEFQQNIGLPLPESFYDFYRWHNGSAKEPPYNFDVPFQDSKSILSLSSILRIKEMFDSHQKEGIYDRWLEGAYWDYAWMPFMYNDWFVQVIDTKGSFGGNPGQILGFDYKSEDGRCISHTSFDKWLETIIELKKADLLFSGMDDESPSSYVLDELIREIYQKVNGDSPFYVELWKFRLKKSQPNPYYHLMVEAIKKGDFERVKNLIDKNLVGLNEVDEYSEGLYTPLIQALNECQIEIAKYLIDKDADLKYKDASGLNAFTRAVQTYNYSKKLDIQLIDIMRQKGAEIEYSYLMSWAVENNDLEMLKYCFDRGADPNEKMKYPEQTLLHHAIERDSNIETINFLVNSGVDVNKKNSRGETAIDLVRKRHKIMPLPAYSEIEKILKIK